MRQLTLDETHTTRKAAREAGALLYFPDAECPRGHKVGRYVSSGGCVECNRITQRELYAKNRVVKRRQLTSRKLRDGFGITEADYAALFEKQKGCCAICDKPLISRLDDSRIAKTRQPEIARVDHCHVSGKVRGLLCLHCNTGIGHLKDSEILLLSAVRYLHESATAHRDNRNQHDTLKGESGPETRDPYRTASRGSRRDELSPFN